MPADVRRSAAQVVRYVLSGGVVYGIDLGTFLVLNYAGAAPAVSNPVAKAVGALAGFLLHATFTFGDVPAADGGRRWGGRRFLRYALVFVANAAGTTLLLVGAVAWLGASTVPVRIAIDVLSIVAAFLASKYLVFTPK